jgi:hypothetical protein
MSGQKIVLSGLNFTDTALPIVRDDPLLSAGSLFLFDPSHSQGGFAGVPAHAAAVPNVAWKEAAALLGSGTASSLSATVGSTGNIAGVFQVERSGKGGVHGMATQGSSQVAGAYWRCDLPPAVRDYLYANRSSRSFYISIWKRLTRKPLAGAGDFMYGASTSNYLFHSETFAFAPSAGKIRRVPDFSDGSAGITVPADRFLSGSVSNITGTGPASSTNPTFGLGGIGPWNYSGTYNKLGSSVLYRFYIEDLTASGRSAADVDALDYELWQAAFATGGKFHGDTYSDPVATVP